jgi:hypothetical protein
MKALWITLAVLAALGLACCGGIFIFGRGVVNAVAETNAAADRFSAQIFPEIAKGWDMKVVQKYSSSEFKRDVTEQQLQGILDVYKAKLGNFKEVGEFSANHIQANATSEGQVTQVTTNANATFEKGSGKVTLKLIKKGEDWQLLGIEIFSSVLAE